VIPVTGRRPSGTSVTIGSLALAALVIAVAGCGGGATSSASARPAPAGSGAASPHVWVPGKPDTLGPTVAVIGPRRIRAHEVDSLISTAPLTIQPQLRDKDGYKNLVDRMVTEEAVYQAALKSGIGNDPEYKAAAARAERDAMMRLYYQRRISNFPAPTDSMVEAHYKEHIADYSVGARARLRHIQVPTRAKAEALRKKLVAGALWDALARANSTDRNSKDNGGLVGYVTPGVDFVPGVGKAPEIVKAAFQLKEGEISRPLKSERGWHIIKVESNEPAHAQPLSEVRQQIVSALSTGAQEKLSKDFVDSLKATSGAVIFDDSIAVAVVPARTAQDYFKEAQAASTPDQRIQLYRALVARYPKDPVSIQAAFMIGFTYAEDLQKYDEARKEFHQFIATYPQHELAKSAKWMLENMDKPAPDLKDAPEGVTGAPPDSVR
jgi:peptidyl-prolyl cis-trans isomerase C